jgi:tetratricopeptide (TPR) repeat protein
MAKPGQPVSVQRLLTSVEWALANGLGPRDLVPMLERLTSHAVAGSAEWLFAQRQLAHVLVRTQPWRCSLVARRVLKIEQDASTWGVLGLAQTLLGHYRTASAAYRRALALAPDSPECAHNLGHLLDVALDRPKDAVRYLRKAHAALPNEPEVAASLAHALARSGRRDEARAILSRDVDPDEAAADARLSSWLSANPPGSLAPSAAAAADPEAIPGRTR